jgi:hypothetical protein
VLVESGRRGSRELPRIDHHSDDGDYWKAYSMDGLVSYYGTDPL